MTDDTLVIRPLTDADIDATISLWQACELTRPHNDPYQDIALARGKANSDVLVAELKGEIISSVMVGHDGHRGWVYYLSVAPDRQGQGLGQKMMRAAEAFLDKHDIRKLELMVRASNVAVTDFYQKIGYAEEPVVVLSRWLDK